MERERKSGAPIQGTSTIRSGTNLVRENTRQHPRVKVSLLVTLLSRLEEIEGELFDLSLTGTFMLIPELPDHTRPFELIIDLPDGHALILSAELLRFDLRPTGDNSSHFYGVAVRFINVSDEDRFALLHALCYAHSTYNLLRLPCHQEALTEGECVQRRAGENKVGLPRPPAVDSQ